MTSPSEPASVSERLQAVLTPVLGPVDIDGPAAAERRRVPRDVVVHARTVAPLILRRDPPGRPGVPGSMRLEADAMRACRRAGLAVPEVLVDDDGARLGTAGW